MWTVHTTASWIHLDQTTGNGNGTVSYFVDENTGNSRQGYIYVTCGSVHQTHMVAQTRREEITFSAQSANVSGTGGSGSFTVTVMGNNRIVSLGYSLVNWARWEWSEKSLTEGKIYTCTYEVDANTTYAARSVDIPISFNGTDYKFTVAQGIPVNYIVTYRPGANGIGSEVYDTKMRDVALTLKSAIFTRTDGYTQKGWATTDGGGKKYDLGASYTKNTSIALYPYWEKNSSVTTYDIYLSPGTYGDGGVQTMKKYKGDALTLPGVTFYRDKYEQTGWSTRRAGDTKAYELGGKYTADESIYLYPYWTKVETPPKEADFGFNKPSGWEEPLYLSPTNVAVWAYAPQYVFEQGGGLILNYCVYNYGDEPVTLREREIRLWDGQKNAYVESVIDSSDAVLGAKQYTHFYNWSRSEWLASLAPGNYAIRVWLDPNGKLKETYTADNFWIKWFAVKADGISCNEALDCNNLQFIPESNGLPIFAQTSDSVTGGSCIQFGPQPTNNFNTALWAKVSGTGTLSFKWKAVANDNKACMVFYVDGNLEKWVWGGANGWADISVAIGEGEHWVSWKFWTYDVSPSALAAGWLDNVVWNPDGKKPTFTIDSKGTLTGVQLNGVTDLEIPSMVNSIAVRAIGAYVLTNTPITSLSIPDTVTNIAHYAFYDNRSLAGVTIPGSVVSIGQSAFNACSSLKSVVLCEGVRDIGNYAFYNCGSLSVVNLPASAKNIRQSPFGMCGKLHTISVAPGNWYYIVENNALIDISSRTLVQYPSGRGESEYEVPYGLFEIGYDAFDSASSLRKLTIPASVTALGRYAFWKCSNLTNVVFNGNAPTVGASAFSHVNSSCKALVSPQSTGWGVSIPGTWQGIGIEYSAALQTYAVTYNPGAYGTGNQQSETKQHGVPLPLKSATFTRIGYEQTGWATSDGGAKAYELGASYTTNAAVTLYPYWTANTYAITYDLDGGTASGSMQTGATYDEAFFVPPPTKDGYIFSGWAVLIGLDITTAKYGQFSYEQTTMIENPEQQCFAGFVGLWFINLSSTPCGAVTLSATWEPEADDSRDIGFYAPDSQGWSFPVCLSSTNIEYLAYAPETEFLQGMGVYLSFCAVNWSTVGPAMLQSTLLTITDESGAIFEQGEPIQRATIGAFGYREIRNMSMRRYLSGITPGRYKLTLELDPNRLLNDPDRSNNTTSIWFTVTAPSDPIPELPSDATAADVRVALAGSADERLAEYLTDISAYSAYREWAQTVRRSDGATAAGKQMVKSSDKTWFSFAVDSPTLVEREIVKDDIKVENFAMSLSGGQFDFTVGITGVEIGNAAKTEYLKTVFGIEGASRLNDNAFSPDNLALEAVKPEDGKVKITVKLPPPKTGEGTDGAAAFFMRAKVKVK